MSHLPFVLGAYAVAAVILVGMVVSTLHARHRARTRLDALTADGRARRRAGPDNG